MNLLDKLCENFETNEFDLSSFRSELEGNFRHPQLMALSEVVYLEHMNSVRKHVIDAIKKQNIDSERGVNIVETLVRTQCKYIQKQSNELYARVDYATNARREYLKEFLHDTENPSDPYFLLLDKIVLEEEKQKDARIQVVTLKNSCNRRTPEETKLPFSEILKAFKAAPNQKEIFDDINKSFGSGYTVEDSDNFNDFGTRTYYSSKNTPESNQLCQKLLDNCISSTEGKLLLNFLAEYFYDEAKKIDYDEKARFYGYFEAFYRLSHKVATVGKEEGIPYFLNILLKMKTLEPKQKTSHHPKRRTGIDYFFDEISHLKTVRNICTRLEKITLRNEAEPLDIKSNILTSIQEERKRILGKHGSFNCFTRTKLDTHKAKALEDLKDRIMRSPNDEAKIAAKYEEWKASIIEVEKTFGGKEIINCGTLMKRESYPGTSKTGVPESKNLLSTLEVLMMPLGEKYAKPKANSK